jgi:hypothetical protein
MWAMMAKLRIREDSVGASALAVFAMFSSFHPSRRPNNDAALRARGGP